MVQWLNSCPDVTEMRCPSSDVPCAEDTEEEEDGGNEGTDDQEGREKDEQRDFTQCFMFSSIQHDVRLESTVRQAVCYHSVVVNVDAEYFPPVELFM